MPLLGTRDGASVPGRLIVQVHTVRVGDESVLSLAGLSCSFGVPDLISLLMCVQAAQGAVLGILLSFKWPRFGPPLGFCSLLQVRL